MHTATHRRLVPARIRTVAAGIAATALVLMGVATAPVASAAPTPSASASPTTVSRYGTSTVTLTLDGESSTQSTPTDLVLVLDESGSIDATEFAQLNSFANSVVSAVATDGLFSNGGRVGVVGFSTTAETVIGLSSSQTDVQNAISGNPQSAGNTCIACGLDRASLVLGPDDPTRNQLVIVITDGVANVSAASTASAAANLQGKAEVFAVGVGDGVDQSTLETIASGAGADNTFTVGGFSSLAPLLSTLVSAVVVPGATHPSVTVTLDAGWELVPSSVTATLGASVSGESAGGFTVSRADLGDENLVITYGIKHEGAPCGPLNVNSSVAYTDDQNAVVTFPDVEVTVNCLPPVADAGPDKTVAEGSNVSLDGSGSHDPDGTVTAYAWSGADPAIGSLSGTSSAVATYHGVDDGVDGVSLEVTDDNELTGTDSTDVTVTNVAPNLTLTSCPVAPSQVGTDVSFSGTFTDPGVNDTHTMSVDWGDGAVSPAAAATSPVGATHQYASAGIFDIAVTVTDDDGGSDTETCGFVVVFDPDGGFVTGGGWISSPAGAYPADPGATGRASFGFVSKYKKGATVPTGSTEFQFQAGNLNFHSSDYQWLVVAGTKAQYKGTGTVNGVSGYSFMLTATDGSPDRLRMKIWKTSDSTIVYDNQIGSGDTTNPTTALSGGQIVVHKG